MSTTRIQWANALVAGIGAPRTSDALQVVIAWQMQEGQTAGENDPLAHINQSYPHGTGGTSDSFSYASIDNALADCIGSLSPGRVYGSIGDAFRAGKSAADLITAIGAAGWCGGPKAPCPAYAAGVRANFNRLSDPSTYAREAAVLVGSTSLSGSAGSSTPPSPSAPIGTTGAGATTTDVLNLNPLNLIPGTGSIDAIGSAFGHLIDPAFWKRVGVMVLGALLVAFGADMLGKSFGVAPNIVGTAKGVGKAGLAAAAAF